MSFHVRNKPSPGCATKSKVHENGQECIVTDCAVKEDKDPVVVWLMCRY